MTPRPGWFDELINPWLDPRLIAAIDRSKPVTTPSPNQQRRTEDKEGK
jgi:hypothetical protein